MAYFQIDKNSKKKFFDSKTDRAKLTMADYEEAANALMENAQEYFMFVLSVLTSNKRRLLDN